MNKIWYDTSSKEVTFYILKIDHALVLQYAKWPQWSKLKRKCYFKMHFLLTFRSTSEFKNKWNPLFKFYKKSKSLFFHSRCASFFFGRCILISSTRVQYRYGTATLTLNNIAQNCFIVRTAPYRRGTSKSDLLLSSSTVERERERERER